MQHPQVLRKQQDFLSAYSSCEKEFVRYCSALTFGKMNTDDLVQEVLVSVFEHFDRIRQKDKLLHYLIRSARFTYIDQLRKEKFKAELLEQHTRELAAQGASPDTILDAQLVFEAMDQLPSQQAEAILQFEVLGFRIKEIAKNQQSLPGTVKTRISRGRKKLRQIMEDRDRPEAVLLIGAFPYSFCQYDVGELFDQSSSLVSPPRTSIQGPSLFTLSTSGKMMAGLVLGVAMFLGLGGISSSFYQEKEKEKVCILRGNINGKYTQGMLLHKASDSPREHQVILVKDSAFHYAFTFDHPEAYQLVYLDEYNRSSWRPITFFPTDGELTFDLYPRAEFDKNQIIGGELNLIYQAFVDTFLKPRRRLIEQTSDQMYALMDQGQFWSDTANIINQALDTAKGGNWGRLKDQLDALEKQGHTDKSPQAKVYALRIDSLKLAYEQARSDYIRTDPSLVAYYLLLEDAEWMEDIKIDISDFRKNVQALAQLYPDHPYNDWIGERLEAFETVAVGQKCVDFVAPDVAGNQQTLSELIHGQVALLDFWASWCKPCIIESRTFVPLYEEFKDRGFTIVGIAREYKNTKALHRTLEREAYPWQQLVELDDEANIWLKYDMPNSAGKTFLVDQEGTILAIDPSSEQVRKILNQILEKGE